MLQSESEKQEAHADDGHGIQAQGKPLTNEPEIQQGEMPSVDGGIRGKQAGHDVARRKARSQRQHGGPSEPIAPNGDGGHQLRVRQPGRSPINRSATRLVRVKPGNFRVNKALQEAHENGANEHYPHRLTDGGRDAPHGEQDAGRHAAGCPKGIFPIQRAVKFASQRRGTSGVLVLF